MGLGKTIQTIGLIAYIMETKNNNGPFLVVVPLSTLANWVNEFTKWAPDCTIVIYNGSKPERKAIFELQMASGQYNVVLTTYDFIMKDVRYLRKTYWQYIIVDEGHRMKNANSKFAQTLGTIYQSRNRILLTGTPLQNELSELWSLLNFLLPKIFNSVDNFEMWFSQPFSAYQGSKDEQKSDVLNEEERILIINRLHAVLRPFVMRRIKDNVLDQLPDKTELVVRCELSAWQKIAYRQLAEHGCTGTAPGDKAGKTSMSLSNILMQLRKICNHPYLFVDTYYFNEDLFRTSGKFELLDRVLPKLKQAGHRVLMFSQMTKTCDILEDYFRWRQYAHLRLDGGVAQTIREQDMFKYNAPDSPYFIFLLSTRAGGLGLNLATADTVIIFDSDWNPQMDEQASARAHRIGQKNEVRILRLISSGTIEEKILSSAQDKMAVTGMVVDAGRFNKSKNSKSQEAENERRALLQKMLHDKEGMEKERAGLGGGSKVESDEALNRQIAVGDDEFELYQRMDIERQAAELAAAKAAGLPGGVPKSRLMVEQEVPSWVTVDADVLDPTLKNAQMQEAFGRGSRKHKETVYNDGSRS
jgi:SNF2 family DNA or RNA helicase